MRILMSSMGGMDEGLMWDWAQQETFVCKMRISLKSLQSEGDLIRIM